MIPRTIETLVESIEDDTILGVVTGKLQYDKPENRLFTKDPEFRSNHMRDSMILRNSYAGIDTDEIIAMCRDISITSFERTIDPIIITDQTSNEFVIAQSIRSQTDVLGDAAYIAFVFPNESTVIHYADHYYADGGFVFTALSTILVRILNQPVKYAPPIPYIYIPLISEAAATARWREIGSYVIKYPLLNRRSHVTQIYHRTAARLPNTNRWVVYARALLPLFQYSDRQYLHCSVTVGLDVSRVITNNRIGTIFMLLHRPDNMALPEEEIVNLLAHEIETQITSNYTDAFMTYDAAVSLDSTLPRKFGFTLRGATDVVLSPFYLTLPDSPEYQLTEQEFDIVAQQYGCFGGAVSFPFLYISTVNIGDYSGATYQTNCPDMRFGDMVDAGEAVNGARFEHVRGSS